MKEFHDSFNIVLGIVNKDIDLFDNPYIQYNIYDYSEKVVAIN